MRKALLGIASFISVSILCAQDSIPNPPVPVPPPVLIPPPMPPKEGMVPDHDAMMLIWPELREQQKGDKEALKKAIESKRLIDKIKGLKIKGLGSEAAADSHAHHHGHHHGHNEKFDEVDEEEIHELEGRFSFYEQRLAKSLVELSHDGIIPEILIQDLDNRLWKQRISYAVGMEREPVELLHLLSTNFQFDVKEVEGIFVLSPKVSPSSKASAPRINLHLEKVPLELAIKTIAKTGRVNLILPEALPDAKLNLKLESVSVEDALRAISKAYNLRFGKQGDIYYFNP